MQSCDHVTSVDLNRSFPQQHARMANEHMKRCSAALGVRELPSKTAMKCLYLPARVDETKTESHGQMRMQKNWDFQALLGRAAALENSLAVCVCF